MQGCQVRGGGTDTCFGPQDSGGLLHNNWVVQQSFNYLSLTIEDVPNLDPRFLNEPYSGSVPENCDLVRSLPAPVSCPWPWPSLGALTP